MSALMMLWNISVSWTFVFLKHKRCKSDLYKKLMKSLHCLRLVWHDKKFDSMLFTGAKNSFRAKLHVSKILFGHQCSIWVLMIFLFFIIIIIIVFFYSFKKEESTKKSHNQN